MHDYVPSRQDEQQSFVNETQTEAFDPVDEQAQEFDLRGQLDQDDQATGQKRGRDHLADHELDEELIEEVDIYGKLYVSPNQPVVPDLPALARLEVSSSSITPTAPEGGSSSSQLPSGSNLT